MRGQSRAAAYSSALPIVSLNSVSRPGKALSPSLALLPVAGERVEQSLLYTGRLSPFRNVRSVPLIGEEELDPLKAVPGGRGKAVLKIDFIVHHRQVGGEIRHGINLSGWIVGVSHRESGALALRSCCRRLRRNSDRQN